MLSYLIGKKVSYMRGEELLIFTSWNIHFLKNEKIKVLRMQEISSNPVLILILIESSSSN